MSSNEIDIIQVFEKFIFDMNERNDKRIANHKIEFKSLLEDHERRFNMKMKPVLEMVNDIQAVIIRFSDHVETGRWVRGVIVTIIIGCFTAFCGIVWHASMLNAAVSHNSIVCDAAEEHIRKYETLLGACSPINKNYELIKK